MTVGMHTESCAEDVLDELEATDVRAHQEKGSVIFRTKIRDNMKTNEEKDYNVRENVPLFLKLRQGMKKSSLMYRVVPNYAFWEPRAFSLRSHHFLHAQVQDVREKYE